MSRLALAKGATFGACPSWEHRANGGEVAAGKRKTRKNKHKPNAATSCIESRFFCIDLMVMSPAMQVNSCKPVVFIGLQT